MECLRKLTLIIAFSLSKNYNNNMSSQDTSNKASVSQLYQAEQYPVGTIVRIDDDYCSRSGYFQMQDMCFQLTEMTYGNNQMRKQYNITKELKRYFAKRYFFFSMFDQGIELDNQSWYSVVAEPISLYLCQRLKYCGVSSVCEPFCGVGGIAIHAAGNFQTLVVNDIDPEKIRMLKNNLSVYGKGLNLLTIQNKDYAKIKPFQVDAMIVCPPWGGIEIGQYSYRDLDQIMKPKLSDILNHCKKFSQNIVLQMPKNTNLKCLLKIINLCFLNPIIKVEKIVVDGRVSQLFVYIGSLKFTAVNPQVLKQIIKDSGRQVTSLKEMKKDVKKKMMEEKYDIFDEIYSNNNARMNKHIFFD